jgi:copper oxidase (laccase) domain-containing protein
VSQFPSKYVVPKRDESFRVDLKEMVIDQLISMGINSNLIHDSGLCTFCREDLFFSYRRDKDLNGRMIAVMGWAESVA